MPVVYQCSNCKRVITLANANAIAGCECKKGVWNFLYTLDDDAVKARSLIERRVKQMSDALIAHNTRISTEVASHAGHSHTRHGWQTGWEAQLIRCVTQQMPDQPHNPTGAPAFIRHWTSSENAALPFGALAGKALDAHGASIDNPSGAAPAPIANYSTAPGTTAGGFLSPEAQADAIAQAKLRVSALTGYNQAYVKNPSNNALTWRAFNRFEIVVAGRPDGFGLSFARKTPFVPKTRSEVETAIDEYLNNARVGRAKYVNLGYTETYAESKAYVDSVKEREGGDTGVVLDRALQQQFARKFPTFESVLAYLNVEAIWMKNAKVILQADLGGAFVTLITAYPTNDPVALTPVLPKPFIWMDRKIRRGSDMTSLKVI
jgi:hypothetical protein